MKKIVVTFAGRKPFLEILFKYILKYRRHFDEYHIYASTDNLEDLNYIDQFASSNNDFVKVFHKEDFGIKNPELVLERNRSQHSCNYGIPNYDLWNIAWKNSKDKNSVYLKLDDDIVYLDETIFTDFLDFRINNRKHPMIYPLIINNNYSNCLLQDEFGVVFSEKTNFMSRWESVVHLIRDYILNNGIIPNKLVDVIPQDYIFCPVGWGNLEFVKSVHKHFLDILNKNEPIYDIIKSDCIGSEIINNAPMSIGCVSWLGESLSEFTDKWGEVWQDEPWVSVYLPILSGKNNYVYYGSIVSHFSYYRQMELGIMDTDILKKYKIIADKICE